MLVAQSSDSLWPHGLQPARLLCPWNSPGQNTDVVSHSLLEGIFLTQESNLGLLHCRWSLYHLNHQGNYVTLYISKYWVGQNIHLGFSITSYEKTQRKFWPTQYKAFHVFFNCN